MSTAHINSPSLGARLAHESDCSGVSEMHAQHRVHVRGQAALLRSALCAACCATASASVHGLTNSTSVTDIEATEIALHVGICLLCIIILMLLRCTCLYREHKRRQAELIAKVDELQRAQNPVHAEAPKSADEAAPAASAVPMSPPTLARISDLGRERVYQKHNPRRAKPAQRRMTQVLEFMLTVALDVPTTEKAEAAARGELKRDRVKADRHRAERETAAAFGEGDASGVSPRAGGLAR